MFKLTMHFLGINSKKSHKQVITRGIIHVTALHYTLAVSYSLNSIPNTRANPGNALSRHYNEDLLANLSLANV